MTDYGSLAVHDIRTFLWKELTSASVLDVQDYYADGFTDPLIPIIPTQQVPEFNNNLPGKPYIVYDYETLPVQEQWWLTHEMMQFMIVSNDYDQINTIMNFMKDLFRRYDNTAEDIAGRNSILSKNFIFKYTAVHRIFSPGPFKSEGGLMVGHIDILVCYTRIIDSNGRF